MALLLSAVGQIVQPSMVTAAGLSARVSQAGGWEAHPRLPNCSGGVLVLEDMHKVERSRSACCRAAMMRGGGRQGDPDQGAAATYSDDGPLG